MIKWLSIHNKDLYPIRTGMARHSFKIFPDFGQKLRLGLSASDWHTTSNLTINDNYFWLFKIFYNNDQLSDTFWPPKPQKFTLIAVLLINVNQKVSENRRLQKTLQIKEVYPPLNIDPSICLSGSDPKTILG